MQVPHFGIGEHHGLPHVLERLIAAAAFEIVPNRGEAIQFALRGRQMLPVQIRLAHRNLQPAVDVGEGTVQLTAGRDRKVGDERLPVQAVGERDGAVLHYRRAAGLYRGEYLAGDSALWVQQYREWLKDMAICSEKLSNL